MPSGVLGSLVTGWFQFCRYHGLLFVVTFVLIVTLRIQMSVVPDI